MTVIIAPKCKCKLCMSENEIFLCNKNFFFLPLLPTRRNASRGTQWSSFHEVKNGLDIFNEFFLCRRSQRCSFRKAHSWRVNIFKTSTIELSANKVVKVSRGTRKQNKEATRISCSRAREYRASGWIRRIIYYVLLNGRTKVWSAIKKVCLGMNKNRFWRFTGFREPDYGIDWTRRR